MDTLQPGLSAPSAIQALTPPSPAPSASSQPDKEKGGSLDSMLGSMGAGGREAAKKVDALNAETMKLTPPKLELPPKPQPQHTDPVDAWGSIAMVFAGLASLKVRNHASTAMNAAAAAMKGFQQKDQAATEQAFKEWEVSTKNAIEMANFQQQAYKTLLESVEHKENIALEEGRMFDAATDAKFKVLTTVLGDAAAAKAYEDGGVKAVADLQNTRERQKQQFEEKKLEVSKQYNAYQARQLLMASPEFQAADDIAKMNMLAENQKEFGTMSSGGRGYVNFTPQQQDSMSSQMANLDKPMFSNNVTAHSESAEQTNEMAIQKAKEKGLEISTDTYDILKRQQFNATSGKDAATIRSLTVVKNHLDLMDALIGRLPDTSDVKAFNWAVISLAKQMTNEDVSDFNAAKQLVVQEVLKAVSGTGASAEADRRELEDVFDPAKSKAALYHVTHTIKDLVSGQVEGLTTQYGKYKPATEVMATSPETLKSLFIDPVSGKVDKKLVQADEDRIQRLLHPDKFKNETPVTDGAPASKAEYKINGRPIIKVGPRQWKYEDDGTPVPMK
jgi:hypothetical protein